MKSFLLPAMVFKLGQYVHINENNEVVFSEKAVEGSLIMAQEVGGEEFVCKLISNQELTAEKINKFFEDKAKENIDEKFTLKIKAQIEKDEDFLNEIDKEIEKQDLGRKEERKYETEVINKKVEEIAFRERLIRPGSIVRGPLSSSKEKSIIINNKEYPLYESRSLIYNAEGLPSISGIYYVSQNRHSFPLRFRPNQSNLKNYYWEANNDLMTKNNVITLLNHGLRTLKEKNGFLLYFRAYNTSYEEYIKGLVDSYKNLPEDEKNERYKEVVEELKNKIIESDDLYKKLIISLPTGITKSEVIHKKDNLLKQQPKALSNILFKNTENKLEKEKEIIDKMEKFIIDEGKNLYSVYSIISEYEEMESDTYGFLSNNIKSSSITMSTSDYKNFITKIKPRSEFQDEREEKNPFFAKKQNKDGKLIL